MPNQRLNCKWPGCNCLEDKEWMRAQPCRWIYVIEIDASIKDDLPRWNNLKKQNTDFANEEDVKGYRYVGETVCVPENRLTQHQKHVKKKHAKCWKHMNILLEHKKLTKDPNLAGTLSDQAKEREKDRANELREEGYWVWSK